MEEQHPQEEQTKFQVHVSPELEYLYRDVYNIFVGPGEVVIEFGNRHRSVPNHATISNRIVLSVSNAYGFCQNLQQALKEAQNKAQQVLNEQKKAAQLKPQPGGTS
jgi:hypothetical protein